MTDARYVLAISSAYDGAAACVMADGIVLARGCAGAEHGLAAALPAMLARLLDEPAAPIDLVAVVVGPGSFTGLRAGLSVAHGVALGMGVPIVGVTVAEALAEAAVGTLDGRELWTAIAGRTGQIFLDHGGRTTSYPVKSLPAAPDRVAVCGDATNLVASVLAARGSDVMLTAIRKPLPQHVANIALRHAASGLPPVPAMPLYIEESKARLSSGLRPRPLPAGMA